MNKTIGKKPELVAMGLRLKELREEKKKSQKEAFTELKLKGQSVLSSYELGDREPPYSTINNIARYYGVTVDYLTGNSDIRNSDTGNLLKALPFNEKTITKLLQLSANTNGFFEELINLDGFSGLVNAITRYKNTNPSKPITNYGLSFDENGSSSVTRDSVYVKPALKMLAQEELNKLLEE